ncbi:MAG: hypothetical protein ACTSVU_02895 [Promethearchaeota archaeon]
MNRYDQVLSNGCEDIRTLTPVLHLLQSINRMSNIWRNNTIFPNLTQKGIEIFQSHDTQALFHYYQKSTRELANQYVNDKIPLTEDEKERLMHEATHVERNLLMLNMPFDDPILFEINKRYEIKLDNDMVVLL